MSDKSQKVVFKKLGYGPMRKFTFLTIQNKAKLQVLHTFVMVCRPLYGYISKGRVRNFNPRVLLCYKGSILEQVSRVPQLRILIKFSNPDHE